MEQQKLISKLAEIIDDSNAGILCTSDKNGKTHVRWMTPILIRGRKGVIYSVTSQNSRKVDQILQNSDVTWMIQTSSLDQVITIHGKTNVLENPSIKSELLETVGNKLTMFWRINEDLNEFVVLETVIEKAAYFVPMKGVFNTVHFS
ncbi:MAG: pyridoxamine 5'-phosphate oxidase family protein [Caldicoprobacterales bacterium]|nr:pyridoxamine 5'-phosphate oxidase family protein [Clostridiales bacterium]